MPEKQEPPIRIVLPFKDHKFANAVRRQLADLSTQFERSNMNLEWKKANHLLWINNALCIIFSVTCLMCVMQVMSITPPDTFNSVLKDTRVNSRQPTQRAAQYGPSLHCCCFNILRKCQNKLVCLIFETLFIKELKPNLNKQCDSIRAKLFV